MSHIVLEKGDFGTLVEMIQIKLNGFLQDPIATDKDFGQITKDAVIEVQRLLGFTGGDVDGRVGRKTSQALGLDFRGLKKNNGTWKKVSIWIPEKGEGFRVFNRESYGDQFGTQSTIDWLIAIAKEWNVLHPEINMQIGDISRIYGGIFINPNTGKLDHSTHRNGKQIDMRPFRSDGVHGRTTFKSANYSRDLTEEFLRLIRGHCRGVLFNDPNLIQKGLCTKADKTHDNHLHIFF